MRSPRRLGGLVALALVCAFGAALDAGCSGSDDDDSGAHTADGGGGGADGGGITAVDAGIPPGDVLDAGPAADATPPPMGPPPGEGGAEDASFADQISACYDGFDNDGDGLFDCADSVCQVEVSTCCVGRSSDLCCSPNEVASIDFAGCRGNLAVCAGSETLRFFGPARPTIEIRGDGDDATLAVNGDAADVGFVHERLLDPRSGDVTLRASIALPAVGALVGVDALGIGFLASNEDPDAIGRARPMVGLLVSRNQQRVSLLLAGEPIAELPTPTDEAFHDYVVTALPDGRVRVQIEGSSAEDLLVDETLELGPPLSLRPIFWGRVTNPAEDGPPTRVGSFTVTQLACDMPAALSRLDAAVVPAAGSTPDGWADARVISSPNVLRYSAGTPTTRMALMIDGGVYLATRRDDDEGFDLDTAPGEPVLSETEEAWGSDGVRDPSLAYDDVGGLSLYFTAVEEGVRSIARIDSVEGALDTSASVQLLVPGATGAEAITEFSHPQPFALAAERVLAVREHYADGSERIGVWRLTGTPERVAEIAATQPSDLFSFERDALGGVSVILEGDVFRAYYAARRGLRWSIGVAVSDDGLLWRPGNGPVLESAPGADALGVRSPSALVTDEGLRLYYEGTDGARTVIGLASAPLLD